MISKKWQVVLRSLTSALAMMMLFALPAHVSAAPADAADLRRIDDYLNSLTTIAADFSQVAQDGSLTGGKFFLKRPGKMRWQYDPPTPVLMIANGGQLVYYDYELQQVSYIPIDSTLASFMARAHINLEDPFIVIKDFQKTPGMIRITIAQADKPEAGTLKLVFSDDPLLIRSMVVTDSQGQVTTVALNNAEFGLPLADKLFVFHDPRKPRIVH